MSTISPWNYLIKPSRYIRGLQIKACLQYHQSRFSVIIYYQLYAMQIQKIYPRTTCCEPEKQVQIIIATPEREDYQYRIKRILNTNKTVTFSEVCKGSDSFFDVSPLPRVTVFLPFLSDRKSPITNRKIKKLTLRLDLGFWRLKY